MTIIFGESSSGKSLLSLKMIKNITGVIYLSLDCDKSIESKLKNSNIKFLPVQYWPNMLDIEREIIIQNRNYKTKTENLKKMMK